ncbi:MAG: alpha/beta hydrolase [Betaproteobacteria bacterium]|nr:alpha/beta hydrolase [Betaproteobacteria bacterium]
MDMTPDHSEVSIPVGGIRLGGNLHIPSGATGIVTFAHGSGSSRLSPRNRSVARELQNAGLATLLMDLLEEEESEDRSKVFDIELLASRLLGAAHWLGKNAETRSLRIGYFGASTGAAAALVAAAREPARVAAIVSRGGRPDMALPWLPKVKAPTLLIVGELDVPVLDWNHAAYRHLSTEKELVVVPGATHLFEEPGAMHAVAIHACRWFVRYLPAEQPRPGGESKIR